MSRQRSTSGSGVGGGGRPSRRFGLLLIPQRGRIDDARDHVVERLGYTYGHLGGRLDE
jgi:hypothetical protein